MRVPRFEALLDQAFLLAAESSWLWTAPNPRVGAIALAGGYRIGRGWHRALGGAHAEEQALRDAGAWDVVNDRPQPGKVDQMVVSLEPCSATGGDKRRRPCTELLIEAGVKKVWIGALDPDPRHQGLGIERLRAAGLEVEVGGDGWQQRFEAQNPAFLGALRQPDLPFTILKWASSLDGKTATDAGVSQWITGPAARAEVHRLRALADAVLAGCATVIADDAALTARPDLAADPDDAPAVTQPLRVVVGVPPRGAHPQRLLAAEGPRLWIHGPGQAASIPSQDPGFEVPVSDTGLDLDAALRILRQQHGVRRLFVEGGARLHGSFLAAGLATAVVRYEAPCLMGGGHGACLGPSVSSPQQALRLIEEDRRQLGADLRRAFLLTEATD